MGDLFLKLLNMSISASYLVFAVLILRFILKSAPKWVNLILWSLVGLRLAVPVKFKSILSLVPSPQTVVKPSVSLPVQINSGFTAIDRGINNFIAESVPVTEFSPALPPDEAVEVSVFSRFDFLEAVGFIYIAVFLAIVIYSFYSYTRLRKKVGASIEIGKNIFVCDYIDIPFILGIVNPKIYLPSSLRSEDVKYVVDHEKAHLKNFHHIYKPIGFLMWAVYWFNPLMLLAYAVFSKDIELACDEEVIKSYSLEEKKAYSYALLSCSSPDRIMSPCPLAFGEVGVKERVRKVLKYKKPGALIVAVSICLCLLAACAFLTDPKEEAGEQAIEPAEAEHLRYPVPKSLEETVLFKEALNNTASQIIVYGEAVSSPDGFISFMNDMNEGREAGWVVYNFFEDSAYKQEFFFDGTALTEKVTAAVFLNGKPARWEENSTQYQIASLSLLPFGVVEVKAQNLSPSFITLFNDRDIFIDHDKNKVLYDKYVAPMCLTVVTGETFANVEDFFTNCKFMTLADRLINYESGITYWDKYPDGDMPFADFYKLMSGYFEIGEKELRSIVKDSLNENDALHYAGGYGGVYPKVIVENAEEESGLLKLYLRLFNVDGSYTDDREKILTVKLLNDNSFVYISLEEQMCEDMEFDPYFYEKTDELLYDSIAFSSGQLLEPMEEHDAIWWWDNYVYDLAYEFEQDYPAFSEAKNQNSDFYKLFLYAVRNGYAEKPTDYDNADVLLSYETAKEIAPDAIGKGIESLYTAHITDRNGIMSYYVSSVFRSERPENQQYLGTTGDGVFNIEKVTYLDPLTAEITLNTGTKMTFKQNTPDKYLLTSVKTVKEEAGKHLQVDTNKEMSLYSSEAFEPYRFVGSTGDKAVCTYEDHITGLTEVLVLSCDNMETPENRFYATLGYGENLESERLTDRGTYIFATDHRIYEYDLSGKLINNYLLPKDYVKIKAESFVPEYSYDDNLNYMAFMSEKGLFVYNLHSKAMSRVTDVEADKFGLLCNILDLKDGILTFVTGTDYTPCYSDARYYDIEKGVEIEAPYKVPKPDDPGIQYLHIIDNYAIGIPHPRIGSESDLVICDLRDNSTKKINVGGGLTFVDDEDVYLYCPNGDLHELRKVDLKSGKLSEPFFKANTAFYVTIQNNTALIKMQTAFDCDPGWAAVKLK